MTFSSHVAGCAFASTSYAVTNQIILSTTLFLVSLLEFLHNLSLVLGIEHTALPRNLPKRLFALIRRDPDLHGSLIAYCSVFAEFIDSITQMASENDGYTSNQFEIAKKYDMDERVNSAMGMILAVILPGTNGLRSHGKLLETVVQLAKQWKPLSLTNPSTMEFVTASCLMTVDDFKSLSKADFDIPDAEVVTGFNLAQNCSYDMAASVLHKSMVKVESVYGITSLEYGITVAELANCFNMLRNESYATRCTENALAKRQTKELINRPDWLYLSIARADSMIGRAEYNQVVTKLEEILDHPSASDTIIMATALRLAKVRRRLQEKGEKLFQPSSPLWIGASRFETVTSSLRSEYLEELACNLSLLTRNDLQDTTSVSELLETVDAMLGKSKPSLCQTPSSVWYLRMEEEHKNQMRRDKRDEKDIHKSRVERCIRLMSASLKQDICDLVHPGTTKADITSYHIQRCIPHEVQYACTHWVQHVLQSQVNISDEGYIYEFLRRHFLHWLEALSLIGKISDSIALINTLHSLVKVGLAASIVRIPFETNVVD